MRIVNLVAILLLLITYWSMGFSPFNWQLWSKQEFENGVVRNADSGLYFSTPGIARTVKAPEWLAAVKQSSILKLSLELKSKFRKQNGPARIFTISLDPKLRNLTVGQENSDLIIRLRSSETNLNGMPGIVIPGIFTSTDWLTIELLLEQSAISVRVDGIEVQKSNLDKNGLINWSEHYQLALGNELAGNRPWLGTIRKAIVEVDNGRFNYLDPGELYIPFNVVVAEHHRGLPNLQLIPFSTEANLRFNIEDRVLNFLWFLPLGFFVMLVWSPSQTIYTKTFITTVFCALVSFSIEFGQLFLPSRITSIDDLILNTIGGSVGAWVASCTYFLKKRSD